MAGKKQPRYFFYNGDVHKRLHISRAADLITAWHYKTGRPVKYSYLDVKHRGERAFSTTEAGRMLNRHRNSMALAANSGFFQKPERIYTLDEQRRPLGYKWCEKNIMDAHEYFINQHIGRPRNDGEITNGRDLPTRKELRAMIRQNLVYGIEVNGEFIPTWDADRF